MKYLAPVIIVLLMVSCQKNTDLKPNEGKWRATLDLGDGNILPFLLDYHADNTFTVYNAKEEIEVTEITIIKDSIIIKMPVYEGVLKGVFTENTISGSFIKPNLNRIVPFSMQKVNAERFTTNRPATTEVQGNWETIFSPESSKNKYIAKGVFEQEGGKVTGTFRTTTGDYRYLEGVVEGDSLKLSTFDGAHAFLFKAVVNDSVMNGMFYSGNHWSEPFTAKKNVNYSLPAGDSLTFLKEGYDAFSFRFPDTEGQMVSLEDEIFDDKVVIVQLMGSWCPNCLDETKFYTKYYNDNKKKNIEFVALAFEYAPTKDKAIASINRLKKRIEVPYPILLAQHGSVSKKLAQEKLPMLNHVLSYPTTIIIDKKKQVRKIHTGFNGPATGGAYTTFVEEFDSFVGKLLLE
ncbi:Redoxin domain protein [unidentified eubacterium SCB49]|nr:Redoxin domain protein [unidentified eubacterium SCB49]